MEVLNDRNKKKDKKNKPQRESHCNIVQLKVWGHSEPQLLGGSLTFHSVRRAQPFVKNISKHCSVSLLISFLLENFNMQSIFSVRVVEPFVKNLCKSLFSFFKWIWKKLIRMPSSLSGKEGDTKLGYCAHAVSLRCYPSLKVLKTKYQMSPFWHFKQLISKCLSMFFFFSGEREIQRSYEN